MLSFTISYWDLIKFHYFAYTAEREDRGWKEPQRQGKDRVTLRITLMLVMLQKSMWKNMWSRWFHKEIMQWATSRRSIEEWLTDRLTIVPFHIFLRLDRRLILVLLLGFGNWPNLDELLEQAHIISGNVRLVSGSLSQC